MERERKDWCISLPLPSPERESMDLYNVTALITHVSIMMSISMQEEGMGKSIDSLIDFSSLLFLPYRNFSHSPFHIPLTHFPSLSFIHTSIGIKIISTTLFLYTFPILFPSSQSYFPYLSPSPFSIHSPRMLPSISADDFSLYPQSSSASPRQESRQGGEPSSPPSYDHETHALPPLPPLPPSGHGSGNVPSGYHTALNLQLPQSGATSSPHPHSVYPSNPNEPIYPSSPPPLPPISMATADQPSQAALVATQNGSLPPTPLQNRTS